MQPELLLTEECTASESFINAQVISRKQTKSVQKKQDRRQKQTNKQKTLNK